MRPVDLVVKKRDGGTFTREEIRFLVDGYTRGEIPDYQLSALLMAILWRGMTTEETAALTQAMIDSGEVLDLSRLPGPLVDKHSTGGVGDKTSLIIAPLAAACGLQVPMMSGRSLGHTGGTLDKLESIPGYRTNLSKEEFVSCISRAGFAMIGQSEAVVPADRKMYALRDVTGTVESIPLITASIMSKKFAEGAQSLVFDVKCGSGAFMKDLDSARALARSLVGTGVGLGRGVAAVISDMDQPLGRKVGNFLEVVECVEAMKGKGPADLVELSLRLTGWMLVLGGKAGGIDDAVAAARARLEDGSALERFLENVKLQGGNVECVKDPSKGPRARLERALVSDADGAVERIDAYKVGIASVVLGAGRSRKEDITLPGVGIELFKVQGDRVRRGEKLALLHADDERKLEEALELCRTAFRLGAKALPAGSRVMEEIKGA